MTIRVFIVIHQKRLHIMKQKVKTHEQNGYYGFCYELILCPNALGDAPRPEAKRL